MKIIFGNKNKEHDSFNFKDLDIEYDKIIKICKNCKFFDYESDFPNMFCDKSCEMIDYWFCSKSCPLNKFLVVENKKED